MQARNCEEQSQGMRPAIYRKREEAEVKETVDDILNNLYDGGSFGAINALNDAAVTRGELGREEKETTRGWQIGRAGPRRFGSLGTCRAVDVAPGWLLARGSGLAGAEVAWPWRSVGAWGRGLGFGRCTVLGPVGVLGRVRDAIRACRELGLHGRERGRAGRGTRTGQSLAAWARSRPGRVPGTGKRAGERREMRGEREGE
jgi:hypothetical protein